jgi:hypothetical protein
VALLAGSALASDRVSKAPAGKGASCGLSCIGEREALGGFRVGSFCGLAKPSVAAVENSSPGRFRNWVIRATPAKKAAAPPSASPPALSFRRGELSLAGFLGSARGPTSVSTLALTAGLIPQCDRRGSRPGELDFAAVDAEGGEA